MVMREMSKTGPANVTRLKRVKFVFRILALVINRYWKQSCVGQALYVIRR